MALCDNYYLCLVASYKQQFNTREEMKDKFCKWQFLYIILVQLPPTLVHHQVFVSLKTSSANDNSYALSAFVVHNRLCFVFMCATVQCVSVDYMNRSVTDGQKQSNS